MGEELDVPKINGAPGIEYHYEIDFDQNKISVNYNTNPVRIFDSSSLPSSRENRESIMHTSRRVDVDWRKIEEARNLCYQACWEVDNLYRDLSKQGIFWYVKDISDSGPHVSNTYQQM